MLEMLQNDPSISENAFLPTFSREDFVGFVLDHLLILLAQGQPDCSVLLVRGVFQVLGTPISGAVNAAYADVRIKIFTVFYCFLQCVIVKYQ